MTKLQKALKAIEVNTEYLVTHNGMWASISKNEDMSTIINGGNRNPILMNLCSEIVRGELNKGNSKSGLGTIISGQELLKYVVN